MLVISDRLKSWGRAGMNTVVGMRRVWIKRTFGEVYFKNQSGKLFISNSGVAAYGVKELSSCVKVMQGLQVKGKALFLLCSRWGNAIFTYNCIIYMLCYVRDMKNTEWQAGDFNFSLCFSCHLWWDIPYSGFVETVGENKVLCVDLLVCGCVEPLQRLKEEISDIATIQ